MLFRVVTLFSLVLAFILSSCTPKHSEIVLAEFRNEKITMGEFEEVYAKNAGGYEKAKSDSMSKLKNFLDLYVNFKMKLRDAQVRGYELNKDLNNELIDYKKKVGVTYILEKQLVEPGIKELYDKRKFELRVSHLMIRPDSTGEESAQKFAQAILDSIKQGADFAEMVQKYTHDNYTKLTGGDIFYVTAGLLPWEFEDACYKTPVGTVYPEVVKTRFGFHIIKVTDKRDRVPEIKASHILVDMYNDTGAVDSTAALAKLDSVLNELKSGADFGEIAKKYSDDPGSKANGGDLGFFQRRMMVKEFDEAAFNLKVGEVSDVIKTNYGYHIIKVTDKKEIPSFESSKEELKKIFKQARYQTVYDELVDSLRAKYNYNVNDDNIENLAVQLDSARVGSQLLTMDISKDKPMFTYAGKNFNTDAFTEKLTSNPEFANKVVTKEFLNETVKKISGEVLLEEEALSLETRNPEFAALMDDYKNGIFIFKLQDDEVWSKIDLDSTKLLTFYEDTKDKYVWPDRVSYSEIFSRKDSLINHYYSLLEGGENFDSLAVKYTEKPGMKEKAGNVGLVDVKFSNLAQEASKLTPGAFTSPIQNAGGYSIVRLNTKEPSRLKTFDEAKAEVSGAFQEAESRRLEQSYLDNLKNRYQPEIYYENLEEAFKQE